MDIKLTKDADKMICEIYAAYLERRKSGMSKGPAKDFADQKNWPGSYCDSWNSPDAKEALVELKHAGLVRLYLYGGFSLETDAIIYMENRFKNGLSEVLDWISKFKNVIPFV